MHKTLEDTIEFLAGDHTILREWLHPDKDAVDLPYSIAHAKIEPHKASLPHTLQSTEVYVFLKGQGTIIIEGQERQIAAGDLVVVLPNENQYVKNTGSKDLVFLCIVSPAWKKQEETIIDKR